MPTSISINKYILFFIFLLPGIAFSFGSSAQSSQSKTPPADSLATDSAASNRSLIISLDGGTNRGYKARRRTANPSTNQKYFEPNVTYHAESGFFASVAAYNTPGVKRSWDELDLGAGYDFTISDAADIDGSIGYTHFTYSQALLKSGFNPDKHDFDAYIKHDFDVFALKLTGDYYLGDTTHDVNLIIELDHEFDFNSVPEGSKKGQLSFDPDATFIAGTLNYYNGLIPLPATLPPSASIKQMKSNQAKRESITNFSYSKFAFNDFEMALPLNYTIGRFEIQLAWHYSIPFNLPAAVDPKPFGFVTGFISYDFFK